MTTHLGISEDELARDNESSRRKSKQHNCASYSPQSCASRCLPVHPRPPITRGVQDRDRVHRAAGSGISSPRLASVLFRRWRLSPRDRILDDERSELERGEAARGTCSLMPTRCMEADETEPRIAIRRRSLGGDPQLLSPVIAVRPRHCSAALQTASGGAQQTAGPSLSSKLRQPRISCITRPFWPVACAPTSAILGLRVTRCRPGEREFENRLDYV